MRPLLGRSSLLCVSLLSIPSRRSRRSSRASYGGVCGTARVSPAIRRSRRSSTRRLARATTCTSGFRGVELRDHLGGLWRGAAGFGALRKSRQPLGVRALPACSTLGSTKKKARCLRIEPSSFQCSRSRIRLPSPSPACLRRHPSSPRQRCACRRTSGRRRPARYRRRSPRGRSAASCP